MLYQEEERTRLKRQSSKQAITLAMHGRWREAMAANRSLLESFPNDVDAHNRLGRAHMELGEYALAREAYEKALSLDAYNTIAKKNLERLSRLGETAVSIEEAAHKVEPQQFIEEVGKAEVVGLVRLAPPEVLAKMVAGDKVNLRVDGSRLTVENSSGEYLGEVEPKHGQRLSRLIECGNEYTTAIVSPREDAATVIIREVYQHPSQAGQLSFPPKGTEGVRPYFEKRVAERVIRRELEYEEAVSGEPSLAVIGGEEAELLAEDHPAIEDALESEE